MATARFEPSTRMIAGVALALFSFVLVGVAIHNVILGGSCSSTGYSTYGYRLPKCPEGTGWYGAVLAGGVVFGLLGSILGNAQGLIFPGLFGAIGIGALTVALDNPDQKGAVAFGLVFGGCFVIGGLIGPAIWLVGRLRES